MRRRTPTQLERVAGVLERHGRTSELDWRGATIDGGPQINRLASRIAELRSAGWVIDSRERRHSLALYRLISRPLRPSGSPDADGRPEPSLFEPPAARPAGPYDDLEPAA